MPGFEESGNRTVGDTQSILHGFRSGVFVYAIPSNVPFSPLLPFLLVHHDQELATSLNVSNPPTSRGCLLAMNFTICTSCARVVSLSCSSGGLRAESRMGRSWGVREIRVALPVESVGRD